MDITQLISMLQKNDINKEDLISILSKVQNINATTDTMHTTPSPQRGSHMAAPMSAAPQRQTKSKLEYSANKKPTFAHPMSPKVFFSKPPSPTENKSIKAKGVNQFERLYLDAKIIEKKRHDAMQLKKKEDIEKESKFKFSPVINKCSSKQAKSKETPHSKQISIAFNSTHSPRQFNTNDPPKHVIINLQKVAKSPSRIDAFFLKLNLYSNKKKKNIKKISNEMLVNQSYGHHLHRESSVHHSTYKNENAIKTPIKENNYVSNIKPLCSTPMPQMASCYSNMGFNLEKVESNKKKKNWDILLKAQQTMLNLKGLNHS